MADTRILIVDDQPDVLQALRLLLKSAGYACVAAASPNDAIAQAGRGAFAVALIDLNYSRDTTSGEEGLALLGELHRLDAELPVVVMTAWGSIDLAVRAMQAGAVDFIEKPWENQRLLNVIGAQAKLTRARQDSARLQAENVLLRGDREEPFIARAASMQPVLAMIERVARTDANVLILGENGTGKGVVARRIHALSARAERPLIKVNMGGINENLFESEMFGHVKGAFTDAKSERIGRFEVADGGSLFLDEVGNIPPAQQPKLLRVLEDGEFERVGASRTLKVDVRLISATNADLRHEVAAGRFRKDLLYRLNTVEIRLPPLRERREDIEPMVGELLIRFGRRYQRPGLRMAAGVLAALRAYHWPGNVRELSHVIERSVLMAEGDLITTVDVAASGDGRAQGEVAATEGELNLEAAERSTIQAALQQHGGNVMRAAQALGLSRGALYRRLEKYGLSSD